MRRFITITCILVFLGSGCAVKKYGNPQFIRTVDTQTKAQSSESRPEIDIRYDGEKLLAVKTKIITAEKIQTQYNQMYKRCWTVKRERWQKGGVINRLGNDLVELPFAILQAVLLLTPKPGCETYTNWTNWENQKDPRIAEAPYSGKVFLDCGPAGQYELVTNSSGMASLNIVPLLNRLTRDYSWTIKAKAHCDGVLVTDSLRLNTTQLGVTWDKPRYQPDLPPYLVASVKFIDPNRNQILDAKETAYLVVTLANKGRGDAFQIKVDPKLQGRVDGVVLTPDKKLYIELLSKGESKELRFKLNAEEEVPAQRLRIKISIKELNGFEPLPLEVNLATRPYAPPKLALARWIVDDDNVGMSSGNGNDRLELGEQAEITLFVQNLGQGSAENVRVNLEAADSNLFSKGLSTDLGEIPPGEWRKAVFTLRANNRYDGPENLPISIKVTERRSKFGFQQKLGLPLGKTVKQPKVVKIEGLQLAEVFPDIKPIPVVYKKTQTKIEKWGVGTRYAVLIGINNYIDTELQSLNYSERDVKELYKILVNPELGGYNPANLFLMIPKAERPQDRPTRDNILMTLKWLSDNLKPQDSLLFAFCGHGDVEKNTNFIIPLNGRRALPQDTSIRLRRLFEWLDACQAKRQVVMLDACHSGGLARGERGNRGIKIVSKRFSEEIERIGKVEGRAVLSSCSGDEVSYEDDNLKHGIFSYFVLKGLKDMEADRNKDFRVTVYELGNYVKNEVQDWCKYNRKSPTQTPSLAYKDTSGDIELVNKKTNGVTH